MHYVVVGNEAGRIAGTLRGLRSGRGLSLDQAARRLGVSRRSLVALEQGRGNPSLSTLLRLAEGYGIGLVDLIGGAGAAAAIGVTKEDSARTLWHTEQGSEARLLIASEELELWDWRIAPGDVRDSEAHRRGTREIVRIRRGRLVLTVGGERRELAPGELALLAGDRPHRMENDGDEATEFELVVHEPLG
jgi:transcriptional regulator with XRE-family HTH domain